jgi:hypothetical protein
LLDDPDGGSTSATPSPLSIAIVGSTAPFDHRDGFQGETPVRYSLGIRSIVLFRNATETNGVTLLDKGSDYVDAPILLPADAAAALGQSRSTIGQTDGQLLAGSHFTRVRFGISHVSYTVAELGHSALGAASGVDNAIEVLSNNVTLNGVRRDRGYYTANFVADGLTLGPLEGDGAPVPEDPGAAGIRVDHSGPETYYDADIDVSWDPSKAGHTLTFTFNVTDCFRWSDEMSPGYVLGSWDAEGTHYEPVMSFGPNTITATIL